jgi:hypothetical protein
METRPKVEIMWGWIVMLGMALLVLTAWVRRAHSAAPDAHRALYPHGYMDEAVEALKRHQ